MSKIKCGCALLCSSYTDTLRILKCTMSSFQIVNKLGEFPFVVFGGSYRCCVPSVAEATKATEIVIDGIAGVTRHMFCTRVYPQGRFCCGQCGESKVLDVDSRAWAIRSSDGGCPLVCPKLVCEDCVESEAFSEGCRFAVLAHEDFYVTMRSDAKRARARSLVSRWQGNAKLRKERREFALKSALVFKGMFESRPEGWQDAWGAFIMHA